LYKFLRILLKLGFNRVLNCLGGIDSWKKAGYPLVKGATLEEYMKKARRNISW
jgi:hypothetical protein